MKKFHSLLAILLILTCLLSTLVACKNTETPDNDEEETTKPVEDTDDKKTYPMTEKDKENIFATAMAYLEAKNFDAAYDEFLKIPDYQSEGNMSVAEYLERFHHEYSVVYVSKNDDVNHTFVQNYGYDDFGFQTSSGMIDHTEMAMKLTKSDGTVVTYSTIDTVVNGRLVKRQISTTYFFYFYSESGLLLEMREASGDDADKYARKITAYTYNDDDQLIKETKTLTEDSSIIYTIDYTYENGLLKKATKTEGGASTDMLYEYDKAGRLVSTKGWDNDGHPCEVTYEYDANGRISKENVLYKDADGNIVPKEELIDVESDKRGVGISAQFIAKNTAYTYDDLGRLTSKVETITYLQPAEEEGADPTEVTETMTYSYEKYKLYYNPYN